jgi:hypothetical protein
VVTPLVRVAKGNFSHKTTMALRDENPNDNEKLFLRFVKTGNTFFFNKDLQKHPQTYP